MSEADSARRVLEGAIAAELELRLPAGVVAMAAALAAHGSATTAAVLFYGSVLRSGLTTGALDGVLDFYVLVDSLRDWYRRWLPAAANRVLPPSILYFEHAHEGATLRAKVAVLTGAQFRHRMRPASLDTTMWARYSQPAALAWVRDAQARSAAVASVTQAVISGSLWAARLGPAQGRAEQYWQALYERTYAAELRVEKSSRAATLTGFDAARYARLLPLAWQAAGIAWSEAPDAQLTPRIGRGERSLARAGWAQRQWLGKPLNFVRLVKSAYTFDGGVDYVIWKIERHSGVKLELTPWQRRHPVLASPLVLWRLRRKGAIR